MEEKPQPWPSLPQSRGTQRGAPEEYGGAGLDKIATTLLTEKISIDGGSATTHYAGIGTLPIVYLKRKRRPAKVAAAIHQASCLSEPQAGSDARETRARPVLSADRTRYILNSQKMWITNGGFAASYSCFAKVDGGELLFIVGKEFPGCETQAMDQDKCTSRFRRAAL